jgi:hypothetical protein
MEKQHSDEEEILCCLNDKKEQRTDTIGVMFINSFEIIEVKPDIVIYKQGREKTVDCSFL